MILIIAILIGLLVPDLFVWHHCMRHTHWAWQVLYWLTYLFTASMMTLMRTPISEAWMFRAGMVMILCFTAPKVLFMLCSLLGSLLSHFIPAASRIMNGVGLAMAGAILCIVIYGLFFGWRQMEVHNVDLSFDDLPKDFDGYRIVHLSDFHIGTYADAPEMVDSVVRLVNASDADMICFTGDLVNASPDELAPFMSVLAKMKAKDGIYSIMGNHDYCTYGSKRRSQAAGDKSLASGVKADIKRLQDMQRELGWQMLLNDNVMIHHGGDSIMLAGVENSSKPPFPDYGNLPKALSPHQVPADSIVKTPWTILLSHDPTHWDREVLPKSDVQLMLAGHTHSTQFRLFGWSPASLSYKEYAGLYENGKRKLFISTGTGGNLAFRVGVKPEVVVITLHSTTAR